MPRPHILIISPATARENNGNWQTASRWMRFLARGHRVAIAGGWTAAQPAPDLLIALHARRSAPALAAFRAAHPARPALLVLTGTDLYRDIHDDPAARASLDLATGLVVLQPRGLDELDKLDKLDKAGGAGPALRAKTRVIFQSAPRLRPARTAGSHGAGGADVAMIGHLRAEKDPLVFMAAAKLVTAPNVRLLHIGAALDPALGAAALATMTATMTATTTAPRYRWLDGLSHAVTRRRLRRCRLLVIASSMEGGANVIIEAVTSGVPVLASNISGNRGMLGEDYAGYFALGDAPALARLIDRAVQDPRFYARLRRQCAARATLFAPEAEAARLCDFVDNLVHPTSDRAEPYE